MSIARLLLVSAALVLVPRPLAGQGVECAPALVGPIASTEESRAYRPASSPPLPDGYVDEEYAIACQALGVPYRTTLNVRRPVASGGPRVVVLEPTHPSNSWPVLRFTHEYQERAGTVSVGVHATPSVVERLMKPSNPERYAGLEVPSEDRIEEAILAQVGTRIRLSGIPGVQVGHLILGGYSYTGGVTRDYIDAYHRTARAPDGGPLFDGYFPSQMAVGRMPGALPDLDVPVVELQGEREIIATFERNPAGLGYRRPDGELYRLYEVPGMAHLDTRGDEGPNEGCGIEVPSQFPMAHVHDMALRNLVEWVRDGVAAPRAERIEIEGAGPTIARDEHGNARGGVRTPYLDVPVATYETVSERQQGAAGGGRCDMLGPQFDFTAEKMRALYGEKAGYVEELRRRLDELVRDRWYLDFHAAEILREAEARPAF